MLDRPRGHLDALPGVLRPAIRIPQRRTVRAVQPPSRIDPQKARPLRDPAHALMGNDPPGAPGDLPDAPQRTREIVPRQDIMEILVDAQRGELVRADGDVL